MSRVVDTPVGRAWVRHWDTSHIEVYSDFTETVPGELVGIVRPAGDDWAAWRSDERVVIGYAASREVAVETLLRVHQAKQRLAAKASS
jgi:hypothetical protein